MENFTALPDVFNVLELQGWNDFLRMSEDIYIGLIPAFVLTKTTPLFKALLEASSYKSYPSTLPKLLAHQMMAFCARLEKNGGKNSVLQRRRLL